MLYFKGIDGSEGIDVNKTSVSKECDICHYWYFLNNGFKFQPNACTWCHDSLMMSAYLSDIAILNIKIFNFCCFIYKINNSEAINLIQNADLTKKGGTLQNIKIYFRK